MAVATKNSIDLLTEAITAANKGITTEGGKTRISIEPYGSCTRYKPISATIDYEESKARITLSWKPEHGRWYKATINHRGIQEIARSEEYRKEEVDEFLKYVTHSYEISKG